MRTSTPQIRTGASAFFQIHQSIRHRQHGTNLVEGDDMTPNKAAVWCVIVPCADIDRAVDVVEKLSREYDWECYIKAIELAGRR